MSTIDLPTLLRERAKAERLFLGELRKKIGLGNGTFARLMRGEPIKSRNTLLKLVAYGLPVGIDAVCGRDETTH